MKTNLFVVFTNLLVLLSTSGAEDAPAFMIDSTETTKTSVKVSVILGSSGFVYCSLYPAGSEPPKSTSSITSSSYFASVASDGATGFVTIDSLQPATSFDLYCATKSLSGASSSYSDVIENKRLVSTLCCKTVTVAVTGGSYIEGKDVANVVQVVSDGAPTTDVSVSLSVTRVSDSASFSPFLPSAITLTSRTWSTRQLASLLSSLVPGDYTVTASVSGSESNAFNIEYSGQTFTILSSAVPPPVPVLTSAVFASNGLSMTLTFDSATDKGAKGSAFACSDLFTFTGASAASCAWMSTSVVSATLGGNTRVVVGSNVDVVANKVRAACTVTNVPCSQWGTVSTTSVKVSAPSSAIAPSVAISAPAVVGPCDSPVLDFSGSTGSGGRDWASMTVSVSSVDTASASAAQTFYQTTYVASPPTALPKGILKANFNYDFSVTLCNFLNKCSTRVHRMTVSNSLVPVVSILGQTSRSVKTGEGLLLQAQGFTAMCDGSRSFTDLDYTWSVKMDDSPVTTVVNSAITPSKFRLAPFQLNTNSIYDIQVTVKSTTSGLTSSASVRVSVPSSDLVAFVAGGSQQSVRQGSSITLDASGSYDADLQDKSDISQLSFGWTCSQSMPTMSSDCGLDFAGSGSKVTATPKLSAAVGNVYTVSVKVSDANRQSSATLSVTISEADAPVVGITMRTPVTKINPSSELVLLGNVKLAVPAQAVWSVSDASVDITSQSKTPTAQTLPFGTNSFNLVLSGNSLTGKALPYVFYLTVGSVTSAMSVLVNTPPLPGTFTVDPPIDGTEMDTRFVFSASKWSDDDVPVSYEFSYLSKQGIANVVRGRAEATFGSSTLPAGDSTNNYALVCQVRVFDSLNADTSTTTPVTVNKLVISQADLKDKIANRLSASSGDVDGQKETLSVASTMLNSKDCSSAPNCAGLFRDECVATANTCGSCLDGYIGTAGDDNSACVDPSSLASTGGSCSSNSDCSVWESCASGSCVKKSKSCTNDCSGHGSCGFVTSSTGKDASQCFMGDDSCNAVCSCADGYGGSICQMENADLAAKQDMRKQLLSNLASLAVVDEPSEDSINSWQSTLSAITTSPDELNADSADVALTVAGTILDSASANGVSYDSIMGVLNSVDAATVASISSGDVQRTRRRLTKLADTISLLDSFTTLTANSMVSGQAAIETVNTMFRTTTQVPGADGVVAVPQTEAETASGVQASSCAVSGGGDAQRVSIVSMAALMYGSDATAGFGDSAEITSNSMRVRLLNSDSTDALKVTLVIQNTEQQEYVDIPSTTWANTTCEKDDYNSYTHVCDGGPKGDILVTHTCDGTAHTISRKCPAIKKEPSCQLLADGVFECQVKDFDASSTTCECSLGVDENGNRRKLDALQESGVLEVAAVSTVVATEFADTISTAGNFNSVADLKKTITVILMYGILWSVGLLGVFVCSMRHTRSRINADANAAKMNQKKELAQSSRSAEDIRNYLASYVNEIFPSVFHPTSGSLRLWNEISKHHRYLLMFTAKGKNADTIRIVTCIHLLTVQSMLMFILAVCYDLQFPTDDGTCATYQSKGDCLREKSPFDTTASVCSWTADADGVYSCQYVDTDVSVKAVIIISIVIAIFTSPINLLVDFLFIEVLSAPSPDAVKAAAAESTVKRTMRRVSNVGRRVSAASIQTVKAVRKTVFGMPARAASFQVDTTRLVPDAAAEAHILAAHSVGNLLADARSSIDNRESLRNAQRQRTSVIKVQQRQEQKQKKYEVGAAGAARKSLARVQSFATDDVKVQETFAELCVDMAEQRKVLKRSQQDGFDAMWGVDPTGEFSSTNKGLLCGKSNGAETAIIKEIKYVRETVQAKFEKLRFASDMQTGVEILHLFVLDLLGRDTPVAKIFLTKSEEDFRHSMVVSNWVKGCAWVAVVLINLFFVYFSLLRGLERGQRWQNMYLGACILQLLIEMLFYETTECAIVHYFIPNLAKNEVQGVSFTLHQAVQKISSCIVDNVPLILDAPRYLFVSTNLAQRFPDLLESVIVQSYHTYSPGELSQKWKPSNGSFVPSITPWSRSTGRVRRFTVTAAFVGLLQRLGATNPAIQRVIIHTIQPLAASTLILIFWVLMKNPLYFVIIAPFVIYKLYKFSQEIKYDGLTRVDSKLSDVHPADEDTANAAVDGPGLATDLGRVRLESRESRASSMVYPDEDNSDGGVEMRTAERVKSGSQNHVEESSSGCDEGKVASSRRIPASEAWSASSDEEEGALVPSNQEDDDSVELIANLTGGNNFDVSSDEDL